MNKEQRILNIINEKVFGLEFYDEKMQKELFISINVIEKQLNIKPNTDIYIILRKIEKFLQDNVKLRMDYFKFYDNKSTEITKEELKYRTAYSALVKKNTTCYGYSEATRILLSLYNIDSKTLLAKLPGEKYMIMHYTTIVNIKDGITMIIDPERHSYCKYKQKNYHEYMLSVIFAVPNELWFKDKISNNGVGILAQDYLNNSNILKNIKVKVI